MSKPKLYIFVGYPGAGKTSIAKLIAERTGAVHIWSDIERHKMFEHPTHSEEESQELYNHLNKRAAELLAAGCSVVFDTNFNFYDDRQKMRDIAATAGADCLLIWIDTPVEVARQRAVGVGEMRNGYHMKMSQEHFDELAAKLEPPVENEKAIKIDGAKLDAKATLRLLDQ